MFALPDCFERRVARLPARGTLLVCTDLQGNLGDFQRVMAHYQAEKAAGNEVVVVFCGDLVHGPSPDLLEPGAWPEYLGTPYADRSVELLLAFEDLVATERIVSLLGNHEHAHIGGPVVPKFWDDEAAVLDEALGEHRERMHALFRAFPLVAVAPCGVVLTHAAPSNTAASLADFEQLTYGGYDQQNLWAMPELDVVGALTWSRHASDDEALALLEVCTGRREGVVVRGHDIVRSGWAQEGRHHACLSSSFGLHDRHKALVRVDLDARYRSVDDLRSGIEVVPLYPELQDP